MFITVTYKAKWQIKQQPKYKQTDCKKLINTNTGKEIKRTMHGLKAGYWISRKFIKLEDLRKLIEPIPKEKLPF